MCVCGHFVVRLASAGRMVLLLDMVVYCPHRASNRRHTSGGATASSLAGCAKEGISPSPSGREGYFVSHLLGH